MAIIEGTPTKDKRKYSFKVYYKDLEGNTKQYLSKKYTLKSEAKEAERLFLNSLTEKIFSDLTFKDLINDYDNFKKDKVKSSTYRNFKPFYDNLSSLYKIKLKEFNIQHFNLWKEKLNNRKVSTRYKNNIYKFFRSILNYAVKYHNYNNISIILNKMTGFDNPNELKKEMKFWTYNEFMKFINKESILKYKIYFKILYYCGLRKGEANALNWKDIDFDKRTININKNVSLKIKGNKYTILSPKTKGSIRILPLPKVVLNDLKALYEEYNNYDNFNNNWFVFGGIYPLADTSVTERKNTIAKKAGFKENEIIRIHDFRHSCASLLINNGASVMLVSKFLGHSNITTTLNTYAHMFKNEFEDIIKVIDNL